MRGISIQTGRYCCFIEEVKKLSCLWWWTC